MCARAVRIDNESFGKPSPCFDSSGNKTPLLEVGRRQFTGFIKNPTLSNGPTLAQFGFPLFHGPWNFENSRGIINSYNTVCDLQLATLMYTLVLFSTRTMSSSDMVKLLFRPGPWGYGMENLYDQEIGNERFGHLNYLFTCPFQ